MTFEWSNILKYIVFALLVLLLSIFIQTVKAAGYDEYFLGEASKIQIPIASTSNGQPCNITLNLPDGSSIENLTVSPPNFIASVPYTPKRFGERVIRWEGKIQWRGFKTVQACSGKDYFRFVVRESPATIAERQRIAEKNAYEISEEWFKNKNEDVRKSIQSVLSDRGLYSSSIDGFWGAGTAEAIKSFLVNDNFNNLERLAADSLRRQLEEIRLAEEVAVRNKEVKDSWLALVADLSQDELYCILVGTTDSQYEYQDLDANRDILSGQVLSRIESSTDLRLDYTEFVGNYNRCVEFIGAKRPWVTGSIIPPEKTYCKTESANYPGKTIDSECNGQYFFGGYVDGVYGHIVFDIDQTIKRVVSGDKWFAKLVELTDAKEKRCAEYPLSDESCPLYQQAVEEQFLANCRENQLSDQGCPLYQQAVEEQFLATCLENPLSSKECPGYEEEKQRIDNERRLAAQQEIQSMTSRVDFLEKEIAEITESLKNKNSSPSVGYQLQADKEKYEIELASLLQDIKVKNINILVNDIKLNGRKLSCGRVTNGEDAPEYFSNPIILLKGFLYPNIVEPGELSKYDGEYLGTYSYDEDLIKMVFLAADNYSYEYSVKDQLLFEKISPSVPSDIEIQMMRAMVDGIMRGEGDALSALSNLPENDERINEAIRRDIMSKPPIFNKYKCYIYDINR